MILSMARELMKKSRSQWGSEGAAVSTTPPLQKRLLCTAEPSRAWGKADVYQVLSSCGIFAKTSPSTVSALSDQLTLERFPSGLVLNAQNDFHSRLFVIASGRVRLSYARTNGCEIALTLLGPTQIFGAKTLFDHDSSGFTITALCDVLAVPIERVRLMAWMTEHPEIGEQLLRLFARYAKGMTDRLVEFAFASTRSRVASRLLIMRQQFGRQDGDAVRLTHELTAESLSLFVDAPAQQIRTALHDFEQRGWIQMEGDTMLIIDAQGLESTRFEAVPQPSRS